MAEKMRRSLPVKCVALLVSCLAVSCSTIPKPLQQHHTAPHPEPLQVNCEPPNGRQDQLGCWVLGSTNVTAAPGEPLYWHVYEYSSLADAERARDSQSAVMQAYGRTWLLAMAAQDWAAAGGRRVASVGPLQRLSPAPHTASFMEATFTPGMRSRVHTHPGPEAWVVLEGEQCLETPEGNIQVNKGESMMVRGGIPMALYGTGRGIRKALVVILHPTGERLGMTHSGWQPTGSCLTD